MNRVAAVTFLMATAAVWQGHRSAQTGCNTPASIEAQVGISVGVAPFSGNAKGVDELISVAVRAMYLAKFGGKNRCLLTA